MNPVARLGVEATAADDVGDEEDEEEAAAAAATSAAAAGDARVGQQHAFSPLTPQHCSALISGTFMLPPSCTRLGSRDPVAKVHAPPPQHERQASASTFATHRCACIVR